MKRSKISTALMMKEFKHHCRPITLNYSNMFALDLVKSISVDPEQYFSGSELYLSCHHRFESRFDFQVVLYPDPVQIPTQVPFRSTIIFE